MIKKEPSKNFSGIYAASLTPMDKDLRCNGEALGEHCKRLLSQGCEGVVLFGTSGEGQSFTVDERMKGVSEVILRGVDPKKIIVTVSCMAIDDAVELATYSIGAGCSGVLVMPPFFYKNVPEEGVIAFYRQVIERIGHSQLRLLLYHIPQYTGVPITPYIVKTLHNEFPGIVVGMKDSEGNLPLIKEILENNSNFEIFEASERLIPEAIRLGAVGTISGIANIIPKLISSLCRDEKNEDIQKIHEISAILRQYFFITAMKAVMAKREGRHWEAVRPPLIPLGKEQTFKLLSQLEESGFKNGAIVPS